MHELSIALGIIDIATEVAMKRGDARVSAVHLTLGALSGVDRAALLFSFEVATHDTSLEGSRLEIDDLPAVIFCSNCDEEREIDSIQHLLCPVCGALSADVRQGRELEVVALELEEVEMAEALV